MKILSFLTIALLLILGSGCSIRRNTAESQHTKIGIVTMTSGDLAFLGENIIRAAQIAIADYDGKLDVELIVEDVGSFDGESKRAVSAIRKLIDVDGVEFVINGISSNGTLAIAPIVNEQKVVLITPLTGGENIDQAGEYIFRNGPSDILAGITPALDIYNTFNLHTVALLTDNAEYTLDIRKHFVNAYQGRIVYNELITPDKTDYKTELVKVKNSNPQALFISTATGGSAHYLIKQARELGIDVPIFTNFLAFGPQLFAVAGNNMQDVYVYAPEVNTASPEAQQFLKAYKETFSQDPPIAFHAIGTYDAIHMGLEAIEQTEYSGELIHDYFLKNIQNWEGLNGSISFDAQGNTQTGFVLKKIENTQLVDVK